MKTEINFTNLDIKKLAEYEQKVTHPKLLLRISVIQMFACWISSTTIQKIKNLSHDTIRRFAKSYKDWWIKGLLEWNCKWRSWRLTEKQKKEIQDLWKKGQFKTAKQAQKYIKENFWYNYKIRQIQKLLKKRDLHTKKQLKYLETVQV